jgi:hypothetical protein
MFFYQTRPLRSLEHRELFESFSLLQKCSPGLSHIFVKLCSFRFFSVSIRHFLPKSFREPFSQCSDQSSESDEVDRGFQFMKKLLSPKKCLKKIFPMDTITDISQITLLSYEHPSEKPLSNCGRACISRNLCWPTTITKCRKRGRYASAKS